MIKKISRIKYAIFLLITLFFLLYSNRMIANFCNHSIGAEKINNFEVASNRYPVYYDISDRFQTVNETLEMVRVSGWAFVESDLPNPEKEINIILHSAGGNAYRYGTVLSVRKDALKTHSNKKVASNMCGFVTEFSVVDLPDDTYFAYIEVIENETYQSVSCLPWKFIKQGRNFKEILESPRMQEDTPDFNEHLKFGCDMEGDVLQNTLTISGWIVEEGNDAEYQTPYINVYRKDGTSIIYSVERTLRIDVAEYFNEPQYIEAGFTVTLPDADTIESICLLLENTNGYFTTNNIEVPIEIK